MKKTNNQQLAELMDKHGKTRKWVAAVVDTDTSTVDRWLAPMKDPDDKRRKNPTYRAMPKAALNLVRLALGEVTVQQFMTEGYRPLFQ